MTYSTYSGAPGSSFTSGTAPGIDAPFLNDVRTFLMAGWFDSLITSDHSGVSQAQAFKPNATVGTLTGTTSGSISYYQPTLGNMLVTLMKGNNYRNASGTRQHVTLPVAYVNGCFAFIGTILNTSGSSKLYFYAGGTGGTQLNTRQLQFGAAGSAGGFNGATNAPTVNWFEIDGAIDTVEFDGSNTATSGGWLFMIGN